MKHSVRLAIAFFVLSTLPVAFVSYVSTVNTERTIRDEIEIHLGAITEIRAADFDRWIGSLRQLIESIAQRPLVVDLTAALVAQANRETPPDPTVTSAILGSHLSPHLRAGGLYTAFSIVDAPTGRVLVSTDPDEVGKFRIGEPYYEEGLAETHVGSLSYTPALETLAMHVGAPIGRGEEPPIAVLVGRVNLDVLGDIVAYAKGRHETEDVYLVDAFGYFVTEPRFGDGYALRRVADSEGVARALAGETGVARYVDYRDVRVLGAFRPLPKYGMALLAEIDETEALAPVVQTRFLAIALLGGAIAVFSLLGVVLARRMTHPLRRIAAGAARIGRGEFGHRIRMSRSDEFGDLSRAFDRMAENLTRITASRDDLSREMDRRRETEERLLATLSALRESERKFRETAELLPESVCECGIDGRITFANRAMFERFGYAEVDSVERVDGLELIVPEERERASEYIRRILDGETIGGTEHTALTKDGARFPVIVHAVAARRGDEIVGLRVVIVDISEQKKAREALQTADEIVSAIPTGILIYRFEEPDRLVLVAGNEAAAVFVDAGRDLGEELEAHWPTGMVEQLRPSLLEIVRAGGIYDREATVGPPEARRGFRMRAFRIPGGRIVLAFEEITERVRAEEALRANEEKYRLLFKNMMDAFALHEIALDEMGRPIDYVFLEVNAAFERMVGLRREEIIGKRVTEVLPGIESDPADWIGRYGRVALTGEEARFEQYAESLGKWYSVLAFRPRPGQFATVFQDVTERTLAEGAIVEWKNRYEGAVAASRHLLYDWDSETNEVTYGGDLERILGYTEAEMSGGLARWAGLIQPEDRPDFEEAIDRLLETREPAHLQYRVRRKSGDYIHVEDDGSFILDAAGRPRRMLGFVKDVTERRLAAERIEESEKRYRTIVDLAPVGIVTVDLDGRVASCNEEFARITGFAKEEIVGLHFTKLPPARARDIPRYIRIFAGILRGRAPEAFEATWTAKDGAVRHGEVHFTRLKREERTGGVLVMGEDITERKTAEIELRASEAKFRDLVEEMREVLFIVDERGVYTYVSPAIERILGYPPEEVIGKPYATFAFEGDYRDIEEVKDILMSTPEPRPEDHQVVAKDGSVRWIRMAVHPILDGGRFAGFRGLLIDVTEQKQAGAALAMSERRYRSLFENAALGIYQTTPDGRILAANPSLVRMLGYDSFDELASRNLEQNGYELETPREQFKERVERDGRLEGAESIWARKDGERLFVRENAVVLRDEEGNVVCYEGTVEDITAQRRAEAERYALEAQLRQTQKLESIGTLASGVAHEINNPLTGMINYAELISRRVEDSRLKEFADAIMSEGARVAKIVRNLLSFSRQEKESHSPARIVDILTATLTLIGRLLERDRIEVRIDVAENLPKIKCRSQQLQQVLLNLLTNARDALNERYPGDHPDKTVRVTAEEITMDGSRWIRTIVEDHGSGISAGDLDRIFDPFFTTKPRDRGTGLGLSVSYGIVRDHRGKLTVESQEGSYTRFLLDLPVDNGWSLEGEEQAEGDDG